MRNRNRGDNYFNLNKLCLWCLTAWLLGAILAIVLYFLIPVETLHNLRVKNVTPFSNNIELANTDSLHRIIKLFTHNSSVGILICIGGFLTAGTLSIVILSYNGFIASSMIINAILADKSWNYIVNHLLWHGVFEIYALIWFGGIGVSGFYAWKRFIQSKPITTTDYFSFKKILFPFILLAIAAIIEGR